MSIVPKRKGLGKYQVTQTVFANEPEKISCPICRCFSCHRAPGSACGTFSIPAHHWYTHSFVRYPSHTGCTLARQMLRLSMRFTSGIGSYAGLAAEPDSILKVANFFNFLPDPHWIFTFILKIFLFFKYFVTFGMFICMNILKVLNPIWHERP